jgi:hypothetical protein
MSSEENQQPLGQGDLSSDSDNQSRASTPPQAQPYPPSFDLFEEERECLPTGQKGDSKKKKGKSSF